MTIDYNWGFELRDIPNLKQDGFNIYANPICVPNDRLEDLELFNFTTMDCSILDDLYPTPKGRITLPWNEDNEANQLSSDISKKKEENELFLDDLTSNEDNYALSNFSPKKNEDNIENLFLLPKSKGKKVLSNILSEKEVNKVLSNKNEENDELSYLLSNTEENPNKVLRNLMQKGDDNKSHGNDIRTSEEFNKRVEIEELGFGGAPIAKRQLGKNICLIKDYSRSKIRKCNHCQTKKTPQWREGPLGPKTLCNACGIRHKINKLEPEYRPAASPTFVRGKHSNFYKRIVKLRENPSKVYGRGTY